MAANDDVVQAVAIDIAGASEAVCLDRLGGNPEPRWRLSRAKAKIKETRIAFEVPTGTQLELRLSAVFEAIYAAYGHAWDDVEGADAKRRGLAEEAIWLARVVVELLPNEPEALGPWR